MSNEKIAYSLHYDYERISRYRPEDESELYLALEDIGISRLFDVNNKFRGESTRRLFTSSAFINNYRDTISRHEFMERLVKDAAHNGFNLYSIPEYKEIIDEKFKQIEEKRYDLQLLMNDNDHIVDCIKWKDDIDYKALYKVIAPLQFNQIYKGYLRRFTSLILNGYINKDPVSAKNDLDEILWNSDNSFSPHVRSSLYAMYINAGFLDEKKARKMRSDSSEMASTYAIDALFRVFNTNPNLYQNKEKLLLQFADSRYTDVQYCLASNAPFDMLGSFVGFTSVKARNCLEARINKGK
jgi:hypothetical protein